MTPVADLLTPSQVADALQVDIKTVWSWCRTGDLPATRIGGRLYRIASGDLVAWLASRRVGGESAPETPARAS